MVMNYAVGLPTVGGFGDVHTLVDLAVAAEQHGWDGVHLWDHVLYHESGWPVASPVVAAAAIAASTSRVRIIHDYVRHGTTTLFAALEVATGRVTDACYPRHRHEEFLRFLKHIAKTYPRRKLHIVCDNYATHKHPAVQSWLTRNPRITLHFTPTSGSWLNMVEIFFGIITRRAIRRGTYTSVKDLIAAIEIFIDAWNERCEPFVWTKARRRPHQQNRPR